MAEKCDFSIEEVISSIKNDPRLKEQAVLEINDENVKLQKYLDDIHLQLKQEESQKMHIEIPIAKESIKSEKFQEQIAELRTNSENIKNKIEDVNEEMTNENAKKLDIMIDYESEMKKLSEMFRSVPEIYRTDKLTNEIKSLIDKSNEIVNQVQQLEEEILSLQNTLLVQNKDNDIFEKINNIIKDSTKINENILTLTMNEKNADEKIERDNQEIKQLETLQNNLMTKKK